MPEVNASRSPIRRNAIGAYRSRAMKYKSRGKPLTAELAAISRIAVVAIWT
jgi:hypothetical protein